MNPRFRKLLRRGSGHWKHAAAALLLVLAACGYTLEGTKRSGATKGIRTFAVARFVNQTSEPGLERTMEDATRNRFIQDGRVRVVAPGEARALLDAVITDYRLIPIGFSRADEVRRYRVFIRTQIRVRDLRKGKTLIKQTVDIDSEFSTSAEISSSDQSRRETTARAAALFADDVLSLVLEGF